MNLAIILGLATVLFPLLTFLVLAFGRNKNRNLPWLAVGIQTIGLFFSIAIFLEIFGKNTVSQSIEWLSLSEGVNFSCGLFLDDHSVLMLLVVQLVSLLVHIYSLVYFDADPSRNRFFSFLGLFISAMNGLIVSDNLLMLFIFWELVGFASYLLIGFWFQKESAAKANKKAFIINRIADLGLLSAILIFWSEYDTLNIHQLKHVVFHFHESFFLIHLAGFGLFLGCMGKSAQFPFQIWLPDAMEGPTPVSALIHAATMVAAGVYLLVKLSFILTPDVMDTIAIIGSITAVFGAFFALSQTDLKRVLAFSTVSQLGFMMAGIGVGGVEASFFHLITHAFFKSCLFLCAGSVIHAMQHANDSLLPSLKFDYQDMRNMGGLWKIMPITFAGFVLSGFALAGIPFFSGFLSKDAILVAAFTNASSSHSFINWFVFSLLVATPCLTAYYIFKLLLTVFAGKLRINKLIHSYNVTIHESKPLMVMPIIVLSIFSVAFTFSQHPFDFENGWIMRELNTNPDLYSQNHLIIAIISMATVGLGLLVLMFRNANSTYNLSTNFIFKLSYNQLYINELASFLIINPTLGLAAKISSFDLKIVDRLVNLSAISQVVISNIIFWIDRTFVDGIVNSFGFFAKTIGNILSKLQNGKLQNYIFYTFLILSLVIFYLILF